MRSIGGRSAADTESPTMSISFSHVEVIGKSVTPKVRAFACYAFPELSVLSTHVRPRPFR